jgi:hypothetical protein
MLLPGRVAVPTLMEDQILFYRLAETEVHLNIIGTCRLALFHSTTWDVV